MSRGNYKRPLWIAVAGAVLAWPFGQFVGLILAAGQAGPGSALAYQIGAIATVSVWAISSAAIIWSLVKGAAQQSNAARVAALLTIAFLPAVAIVSAVNYQVYSLTVFNDTGTTIDDVSIEINGREKSFGVVAMNSSATRSSQQVRPSGNAEIRWTSEDGQAHIVVIDVSEIVPRTYNNGVLEITISGRDNVRVGFFIYPDPPF